MPDGKPAADALKRITHLGIGAHQDDLEFMAFHGILECFASETKWFGGVTCTNGAGSSRTGAYEKFTDAQMMAVRRTEQNNAAIVGQYGVMIQLDYPSSAVKSATDPSLKNDLKEILAATQPEVVYTHNLGGQARHAHRRGRSRRCRRCANCRATSVPKKVIGCEVWRNLDWMNDADKVLMDVSGHDNLAAALNGVFDSQIAGGKRYDLATLGRRAANATFFESHATDKANQLIFGMDLTPVVADETKDIAGVCLRLIEHFHADVKANWASGWEKSDYGNHHSTHRRSGDSWRPG